MFPAGEAKEHWAILRALSESLDQTLPYDSLEQVRARMAELNAVFERPDIIQAADWEEFGVEGALEQAPFEMPITNFYMTDPISRTSETMAKCAAVAAGEPEPRTGTDG